MPPVDEIWISLPFGDHNLGLQITCENPVLVDQFVNLVYRTEEFDKLSRFLQGGHTSNTWKFFEFLACNKTSVSHQELIWDQAEIIANKLGLPLAIK
jgi:hypothetical protein